MPPRRGAGPRPSAAEPSPQGEDPGQLPERRLRSTRLGLALAAPRWALAVADDPAEPGRAGTDLLLLFLLLLFGAHLRALVGAGWLAAVAGAGVGGRALLAVVSRAYTADLAFLIIGAGVLWVAGGPRRALGRAFDLACVALVPVLAVEVIATAVVQGIGVAAPDWVGGLVTLCAYSWSGALLALALVQLRRAPRAIEAPADIAARGRRAGWGLIIALSIGAALQGGWIARHADQLRPLAAGDEPPELVLPRIRPGGALGERVALPSLRGKVVVVEMWATWCKPCLASMPELSALARRDAARGLEVLAVNLDDPAKARALFDDQGWGMTLLYDDAGAADRWGAQTIPHAVVIDRAGVVRGVFRGDPDGAAALAERLLAAQ
jgi:thiol-disulfide isomerase/thioredoxin